MKKALLSLLLGLTFSFSAYARSLCIAQESLHDGYIQKINYSVNCADGTFITSESVDYLVIAHPFRDWRKLAFHRMDKMMTNTGYTRTAEIPFHYQKNFIYEQSPIADSSTVLCMASKLKVQSGMENAIAYNVKLACNNGEPAISRSAVTVENLDKYMQNRGFQKVISSEYLEVFRQTQN